MSVTAKKKSRGYMLMEGLVGSAVLGAALVGAYNQISMIDRKLSESARRGQALSAVSDGVARFRALSVASFSASMLSAGCTTSSPCENDVDVAGTAPGTVKRTITVSGPMTITAVGSANPCDNCRTVRVSVRYLDANKQWKKVGVTTYLRD